MKNNDETLKKLRLGLDIGTNSVGYALLDENNKLIKKNGHTFWGVRMFDEAETAKDRGSYRKSRRRLLRRKERLEILRSFFTKEICDIDPTFFERLDDSFYYKEDKKNKNTYNLFTSEYTDKDFYLEYPTIYHLRKAMQEEDKKFDIRMVYLAIAHIIKYRGNFLYPGEEFSTSDYTSIKQFFLDFNDILDELSNELEDNEDYSAEYFDKIENINDDFFKGIKKTLMETKGIANKKKELLDLFNVSKKSIYNELVIPFISGSAKVNISSLSVIKNSKYPKTEISLGSEELEGQVEEAISVAPEIKSVLEMIIRIKEISDFYFINKILSDSKTISESMVKMYKEHNKDLKKLKEFFKKYSEDQYNEIFKIRGEKLANYVAYVGFNKLRRNKVERFKHASREEFYGYLKQKLNNIKDAKAQEEIKYFIDKMDNNEFLLKQNSNQNGAFPMQLHLKELKNILNNQEKYYPFLKEIKDGYSVKQKIILTFKYKIPYYVGPLNKESKYSWVVREDEKIYPWNFDKVVKLDETAEKFILRMQNKCTYLKGDNDYCLPKNSLIFSEYSCLSYLNKISINGKSIDPIMKSKIFNEVFLTKKQPTKKDIIEFIKANYNADALTTTEKELPEVTCNMASYIKMKEIFGKDFNDNKEIIENIIKDITIFEDKSILGNRLKEVYKLNNDRIKQIKGLNYKGYGRLSKNLLVGLQIVDNQTGEIKGNVIEVMRKTNLNLQEILYLDGYRLIDAIDEYNRKNSLNDSYLCARDYIAENLVISPSFKRALIQTCSIIQEIERIFHKKIDEYYVEVTRTNKDKNKSKTTSSRYDKIKKIYSSCEELAMAYNIDMKRLKNELESNKANLKSDILYFYFTQLGKCMYSLEDIDISDLTNNYHYDIDHIYPQSIIKDDSLSNRVLVDKKKNAAKTDKFLFEANVLNPKAQQFYKKLLSLELISKEKYRRLIQKEMSKDELDGFVNRQLVSTNQSVMGLIKLLKEYYEVDEKNIIYSKGENVSDFRHTFGLVKSRTANNFHHAHDAYLNVVVGGILNKYYTSRRFYQFSDIARIENEGESLNPSKIFTKRDILKANGKIIWDKKEDIRRIEKDLYHRFDITETIRTYNPNEMYSKVTILPKEKGENAVPFQITTPRVDVKKYGGIISNKFSRYVIIEAQSKKGIDTILEAIPKTACGDNNKIEKDIDKYIASLDEYQKYTSYKVANYNIKANVVIQDGSLKYIITGKSGNQYLLQNVQDRFFNKKAMITIKNIDKYLNNKKLGILMAKDNEKIIVSPARGKNNEEIFLEKTELVNLLKEIKTMYSKDIYSFSAIQNIVNNIDCSIEYSIEDFITICNNLLQILKTNERKNADLRLIHLSGNSGTILISKKLKSGMKFIWQSITGYYEEILYEVK